MAPWKLFGDCAIKYFGVVLEKKVTIFAKLPDKGSGKDKISTTLKAV